MACGNSNSNCQSQPKEKNEELSQEVDLKLGCNHYKRNCKLICPCCNKKYVCRLCHDDVENHQLNRYKVERIVCLICHTEQPVSQYCISEKCKIRFGKYFCIVCHFFDNEDRKQFHCNGCGLCRVGGKENFYHCDRCRMCLPNSMETSHVCINETSHRDCPVCLEDIHTARVVSHVPPCGHLIHSPCFNDLLNSGFYACPTCGRSMVQMNMIWQKLDEEISETPMPSGFTNVFCNILCKDCHEESSTLFHTLGLKCTKCGSYNTSRSRGSLQISAEDE